MARTYLIFGDIASNMRNKSAPPKWSKPWTDVPRPGDHIGAYTIEQLEQMNQEFTATVERAFRSGGESEMAATATYDLRRRGQSPDALPKDVPDPEKQSS